MKSPIYLIVYLCTALMPLQPLMGEQKIEFTAKDLQVQLDEVTRVLKTVTDMETAKAAEAAMLTWQKSPFVSQDPEVQRKVQSLINKDEGAQGAVAANMKELERLEQLDTEIFFFVMETLSGVKAVDLPASIEKTAGILDQIKTQADLDRLEQELKEAWKPIAGMMEADLEYALDRLSSDPALQPALQKQKAAAERLTRRSPEVAENARKVMVSDEILKAMEEMQVQAQRNIAELKTKSMIAAIDMAICAFRADHGRMPLAGKLKEGDVTMMCSRELMDVLTAKNQEENQKGIRYINPDILKGAPVVDLWGNPLRVVLDVDGDRKIALPKEYGEKVVDVMVMVDSAGPDGDFKTIGDNLTSLSE